MKDVILPAIQVVLVGLWRFAHDGKSFPRGDWGVERGVGVYALVPPRVGRVRRARLRVVQQRGVVPGVDSNLP